jgi:hypothetical protein
VAEDRPQVDVEIVLVVGLGRGDDSHDVLLCRGVADAAVEEGSVVGWIGEVILEFLSARPRSRAE